jgi:hypothetical protein
MAHDGGRLRRSQLDDRDAALAFLGLLAPLARLRALLRRRGDRELELGLLVLLPLLFFAPANLLDDERRQHRILLKKRNKAPCGYSDGS